ncbi:ferredoxin [Mycolicibacterium sp. XJ1819]
MRVEAIEDQCGAHGYCEGIAPDIFHLGEHDEVQIVQPEFPADKLSLVEQAVARCPKAALRIVE